MANYDVANTDFSTTIKQLEATDKAHADTFNPLYLRLFKNDAYLKQQFDGHLVDDVKHIPYAVATGSKNTYVVTLNPAPTAYADGMAICIKINVTSTGASTLNVNGLGEKIILDSLGNVITPGGLKAGVPYTLRYNGANFIVQGKGGGGNLQPNQALAGYTFTNDNGLQTGIGDTNLLPQYIKNAISIFGVTGNYTGWLIQEGTHSATGNTSFVVNLGWQPDIIFVTGTVNSSWRVFESWYSTNISSVWSQYRVNGYINSGGNSTTYSTTYENTYLNAYIQAINSTGFTYQITTWMYNTSPVDGRWIAMKKL